MRLCFTLIFALALPAQADTLVAARTIRAQSLIAPMDVALVAGDTPGALWEVEQALGMEARVMLYAGRPIAAGDLGPPALIERNQIVTLRYTQGGLSILADARALERAGEGDVIRVMNLASRSTVFGQVTKTGDVVVGQTRR